MTRAHWWLVDKLSWTLEPAERDAVCGDLLEAGETGGRALLNVLGLVVRRQSGLWKNWRPWATLVGLGAPLGILLSVVSRRMAGGTAIPIWMYVNNWTMVYLESPGARSDLVNNFAGILKGYLLLACWSWATGHARVSLPPNHFSQRRPILPCRVVRGPGAGAATSRLLRPQRRRVFADVLRRDVPVDRASRPGLAPLILGNASGTPIGDVPATTPHDSVGVRRCNRSCAGDPELGLDPVFGRRISSLYAVDARTRLLTPSGSSATPPNTDPATDSGRTGWVHRRNGSLASTARQDSPGLTARVRKGYMESTRPSLLLKETVPC